MKDNYFIEEVEIQRHKQPTSRNWQWIDGRDNLHLTFRSCVERDLFLDWKVTNGFIKLKFQKKILRRLLNIFN